MPMIDKSSNLKFIDFTFFHLYNFHLHSNYAYFKCYNQTSIKQGYTKGKGRRLYSKIKKLCVCLFNKTATIYEMSLSRQLCCYCSIILVLFIWRAVRASVECKITSKFSGEEGGRIVVKFCLGSQLIFSLRNRCELAIVWQTHQDLLIRLSLTLVQEKQSEVHLSKINTSKIY